VRGEKREDATAPTAEPVAPGLGLLYSDRIMRERVYRAGADPDFPYFEEDDFFPFPDLRKASREGIVATGGNLSPGMLLSAYRQGIFPWYAEGEPILWWSPDPRFVLFPERLHVSESMRRTIRRGEFSVTVDADFGGIISNCSAAPRPGQKGTWILPEMIEAYRELHRLGYAHSVEVHKDGALVGGLYGVSLGSVFFGESMFASEADASKTGFILLVWRLRDAGFALIDSQVRTSHLGSLGAEEIARDRYLSLLAASLGDPTVKGNWAETFPAFPDSSRLRALARREPLPE
jgi:leucyl/phenylalanyl-tRNA---protein transferase